MNYRWPTTSGVRCMSEEIDAHVRRKYEVTSKVGKGAYGIVWKARDRTSNKPVALKKIFDAFQNSTDAQRTFREIMFLQELNAHHHENIVRLLNVLKADNDRDIYLVFEYMEINLHSVIRAGILEDVHKRYVIYQTAKALFYIHSGGLIHRDLKPSNIMLNADCRAKIIDFGLSRSVSDVFQKDIVLTDYVATRWYRSPEILFGAPQYSTGIDMWALGCILAELLLGKPLFPGESTLNQLERIVNLIGSPTEAEMRAIPNKFAENVKNSLRNRPSTFNACFGTHDKDAVDLLRRLLAFDPANRLSAAEVLRHPYLALFHDPVTEPALCSPVRVHMSDNTRYSIIEYRRALYRRIVQRKQELRERLQRARAARAQAAAQLPSPVALDGSGVLPDGSIVDGKTMHVLPPHTSRGSRIARSTSGSSGGASGSGISGAGMGSDAASSLHESVASTTSAGAAAALKHKHAHAQAGKQGTESPEAKESSPTVGWAGAQASPSHSIVRGQSRSPTNMAGSPTNMRAYGHPAQMHVLMHPHPHDGSIASVASSHSHHQAGAAGGRGLPRSTSNGGIAVSVAGSAVSGVSATGNIYTHPTAAAAAAGVSMDASNSSPYGCEPPRWT